MEDPIPIAYVELDKVFDGYIWVVVKCPYCGGRHRHGGGPADENPYDYLGLRAPHCLGGILGGDYLLKTKDEN